MIGEPKKRGWNDPDDKPGDEHWNHSELANTKQHSGSDQSQCQRMSKRDEERKEKHGQNGRRWRLKDCAQQKKRNSKCQCRSQRRSE